MKTTWGSLDMGWDLGFCLLKKSPSDATASESWYVMLQNSTA